MEGNILFWHDYNKRENFYYYKINSATDGVNSDYSAGSTEWNKTRSYTDTYYYGILKTTDSHAIPIDTNIIEVARYNVAGIKLASPVNGLNIVVYSDGSVKKELVTQ